MIDVRRLKLAIICNEETEEIKAINEFFVNLFNDVIIYKLSSTETIFLKNNKTILVYNTDDNYLNVDNDIFWKSLNIDTTDTNYHPYNTMLPFDNISDIFRYKFIEQFNNTIEILEPFKVCIITVMYQLYIKKILNI